MKPPLPLLAAAALILALAWMLLSGGEPEPGDVDFLPETGDAGDTRPDEDLTAEADSGLTGTNTGAKRPRRSHNPMKPFKERVGELEVLPVDPDGAPIAVDLCTVSLERVNPREPLGRLGPRDQETGVWHFKKVPIGPIRIIVTGDLLVEAREVVRVREGTSTYRKVSVEMGALVKYRAELPDGTVPKVVALELISRQGRPADVYWQVRTPTVLTSARRATKVRLGGEGVVFGIRPGVYELRARTDDGDEAVREVVLGAGDTLDVTLDLR